jgi:hypothetical protein
MRVSNSRRRWSPASDVQVYLIRVEAADLKGTTEFTWIGDIPMRWRNQEASTLKHTIGPDTDCDLCAVGEGQWLQILPVIVPFNLDVHRTVGGRLTLSLQARST